MSNFLKNSIGQLLVFTILIMVPSFQGITQAQESDDYFATLQEKLINDGLNRYMIRDLYARPKVAFETKSVSLYFAHSESKLNYNQYTNKRLIKKARRYMKKYDRELSGAQALYKVDKTVITAIILVETQFGTLLGGSNVLNTLSTMAALLDMDVRNKLWEKISDYPDLTREIFDKKSEAKAEWAYRELKAFIEHAIQEKFDPASIRGSYAGAMGIPQFMPSNIFFMAKDGNEDGRIDLFNHADAIYSVAFYLQKNGWYPDITPKDAKTVVFTYNHSDQYVAAVLKISKILKG